MTEPLIHLTEVTKRYGDVTALDRVDLAIPAGQIVGLLGPNGAGKSTLISLVAGLLAPTHGVVRLFGRDPRHPTSRLGLGVTPQDTSLPAALTVNEVIDQVAAHFPDPRPTGEVLETFGLSDLARRQTAKLSGGQRRRLAVGLATVGRPRLMILDEPTTGLDTDTRAALWRVLRDSHAAGTTIVLTSHYLEEIEALAQRVVLIDHGRAVIDDTLASVLARVQVRHVTARVGRDTAERLVRTTGARIVPGAGPTLSAATATPVALGEPSQPSEPSQSSEPSMSGELGEPTRFLTRNSDAFVRELVSCGDPFADLTVRGASLEEAIAAVSTQTEVVV